MPRPPTDIEQKCSDVSVPEYNAFGEPCIDDKTSVYWSFDSDYVGRGPGLTRILEPLAPDSVMFLSDGVFSNAIRLTVQEQSIALRPSYFLGDHFTPRGGSSLTRMPILGAVNR